MMVETPGSDNLSLKLLQSKDAGTKKALCPKGCRAFFSDITQIISLQ